MTRNSVDEVFLELLLWEGHGHGQVSHLESRNEPNCQAPEHVWGDVHRPLVSNPSATKQYTSNRVSSCIFKFASGGVSSCGEKQASYRRQRETIPTNAR